MEQKIKLFFIFCSIDSFLPGLTRNTVYGTKRPKNQSKLVQQSRQKALRADCPNIYTVVLLLTRSCLISHCLFKAEI